MPNATTIDFARLRQTMVDCQIRTFDVTDQLVLDRMNHVPREMFVPPAMASLAYSDGPLTMAAGAARRTMLTPMVLARMLQALRLGPFDRVLDVAGGAGYSAAVMAGLASTVVALESDTSFAEAARSNLVQGGIGNVTAVAGPLAQGWPEAAPFDAILVNGAVGSGLEALLEQLRDPGRLVCIESDGPPGAGQAVLYERMGGETGRRALFSCDAERLSEFARRPTFAF